ncbi:MAG: hypothetical protein KOO63_07755 [Bacteroidales bacterium]|nr:hypothetical protein [Candidatus Latescibacterota bacterium]
MNAYSKLKPDRSIAGLLPAFFTLAGCLLMAMIFGRDSMAWFVTMVFLSFSILSFSSFFRTRSIGYLASACYLTMGTVALASIPGSVFGLPDRSVYEIMRAATLPFIAWLIYVMVTKKVKWRGRELLELAADPVDRLGNGFTERPRPSGSVEYSRNEISGFADFCGRHLIVLPHRESDRIYFVIIRMGKEFFHLWNPGRDISRDSWVCFDFEGKVSVNISRDDYYEYRDDLEFDKLCASLGDLFVEFLEMHTSRQETRIIDRLNKVRTGWFS